MEKQNNQEKKEGKKILIIEDEKSLLDLLSVKLSKEGYQVETAPDGQAGYKKIGLWKPDLILLDIVMPKMNGYEVLEKLNEDNNKIPVIIISNSGQPVEIEKTKRLGAIGHLIKTEFNPIDVLHKVKNCFANIENGGSGKDENLAVLNAKEDQTVKKLGIKVLLVEDDVFLREISVKKLLKEGFTVYEAVDGEQALEGVKKIKPDIVLLDIILPAIDGFQVLGQIRASEDSVIAGVPIIMLSNLGQEGDVQKAKDMGADDYLIKAHFTTEEIVNKIKEILKKKKG